MPNKNRTLVLHPWLFAIYPIIALLAYNIEEIKIEVALRALIASLLISTVVYLIIYFFTKDRIKAAISTSIILVFFYSYGHIYNYLEPLTLWGFSPGRHRILAPIGLIVLVLLIYLIIRKGRNLSTFNSALNWVAIFLVVMPVFQITYYEFRSEGNQSIAQNEQAILSDLKLPNSTPPDVYYIIVDAYARDDYLREDINFDNTPFLKQLEELGFFIGRCSQSNYSQTQLSLASSLNLDYLQNISDGFSPQNTSRVGIDDLIQHSLVRQAFEDLGYTTVAFETGFKGTQWEDADIYLSPSSSILDKMQISGGLNDFEVMLLRTSAGLIFTDASKVLPQFVQNNLNNPRYIHRQRILFDLEKLSELPSMPGPKFVFAHLVIPHPPYVFGPNGEFTDYDLEPNKGYPDQIQYLNSELIPLLQDIINNSATPPIIILQGDHGAIHAPPQKRLRILNAVYFPGGDKNNLYENISPVNNFRMVLDTYFGGSLPRLDDSAYFSIYKYPYEFTQIPETRDGCK
jgi:hypothetical protein